MHLSPPHPCRIIDWSGHEFGSEAGDHEVPARLELVTHLPYMAGKSCFLSTDANCLNGIVEMAQF